MGLRQLFASVGCIAEFGDDFVFALRRHLQIVPRDHEFPVCDPGQFTLHFGVGLQLLLQLGQHFLRGLLLHLSELFGLAIFFVEAALDPEFLLGGAKILAAVFDLGGHALFDRAVVFGQLLQAGGEFLLVFGRSGHGLSTRGRFGNLGGLAQGVLGLGRGIVEEGDRIVGIPRAGATVLAGHVLHVGLAAEGVLDVIHLVADVLLTREERRRFLRFGSCSGFGKRCLFRAGVLLQSFRRARDALHHLAELGRKTFDGFAGLGSERLGFAVDILEGAAQPVEIIGQGARIAFVGRGVSIGGRAVGHFVVDILAVLTAVDGVHGVERVFGHARLLQLLGGVVEPLFQVVPVLGAGGGRLWRAGFPAFLLCESLRGLDKTANLVSRLEFLEGLLQLLQRFGRVLNLLGAGRCRAKRAQRLGDLGRVGDVLRIGVLTLLFKVGGVLELLDGCAPVLGGLFTGCIVVRFSGELFGGLSGLGQLVGGRACRAGEITPGVGGPAIEIAFQSSKSGKGALCRVAHAIGRFEQFAGGGIIFQGAFKSRAVFAQAFRRALNLAGERAREVGAQAFHHFLDQARFIDRRTFPARQTLPSGVVIVGCAFGGLGHAGLFA